MHMGEERHNRIRNIYNIVVEGEDIPPPLCRFEVNFIFRPLRTKLQLSFSSSSRIWNCRTEFWPLWEREKSRVQRLFKCKEFHQCQWNHVEFFDVISSRYFLQTFRSWSHRNCLYRQWENVSFCFAHHRFLPRTGSCNAICASRRSLWLNYMSISELKKFFARSLRNRWEFLDFQRELAKQTHSVIANVCEKVHQSGKFFIEPKKWIRRDFPFQDCLFFERLPASVELPWKIN